jgi:hypothetical protein
MNFELLGIFFSSLGFTGKRREKFPCAAFFIGYLRRPDRCLAGQRSVTAQLPGPNLRKWFAVVSNLRPGKRHRTDGHHARRGRDLAA